MQSTSKNPDRLELAWVSPSEASHSKAHLRFYSLHSWAPLVVKGSQNEQG